MATVSKWTPFGVALDLTATVASINRTSFSSVNVTFNVSWETYYEGALTNYGMRATINGTASTISSFGTKRSSGSATLTRQYTLKSGGATTLSVPVTFENFNTDNGDSASKTVSLSASVPAWTSYTITYNINGATSGSVASQIAWKGQPLTLSRGSITKTGHTFLGWSKSSLVSTVDYESGKSYTFTQSMTLYAVWKANTYTVKYDANNGDIDSVPANQTKTYGKVLTLSSTIPTRPNCNFKGWGTSAKATTVSYAPGAEYSTNAGITLYAIWDAAYFKPRITNLSIARCDSNGTVDDEGQNGLIRFVWECDFDVTSIVIGWKLPSASTWTSTTVSASGTSGTINHVIGENALSNESSYDIRVAVADSNGSSYVTGTLTSMKFVIDAKAGGTGIAFGKTAELDNVAEFKFDAKFNGPVYGKALGMDRVTVIPEGSDLNNYIEPGCYAIQSNAVAETCENIPLDSNGNKRAGRLEVWSSTGEGILGEQYSYIRQRYIPYNSVNPTWERDISRGADNVWDYYDWFRSSLSLTVSNKVYHEQNVLWSGAQWMAASHTCTLSDAVSSQANGIVLLWSGYDTDTGTPMDSHWNSFFIPKYWASAHSGKGISMTLTNATYNVAACKYVYITDTTITGYADNSANAATKNSGIKNQPKYFVLRYVIGV